MRIVTQIAAVVICCSGLAFRALGQQTPYLEKTVSVRQSTLSYAELFKQLSAQTGVVFSYTNFDDSRKLTVQYYKKPLRVVLNETLNEGNCMYKMKGKYVILTCKPVPKKVAESNDVIVNGYIYSAVDSTLMPQTSVYLKQYRQSVITNEYGYFSLSFPKSSDVLSISVAKENFEDTTVVILSKKRNTVVIYLQPKAPPVKITIDDAVVIEHQPKADTMPLVSVDTLPEQPFSFWERFKNRQSNLRNINDTFFTNYSFSFVPPVSTNHLLAINTVNRYSFNILAGFSHGVDVMEIGGIVNLDYGNVKYLQLAGIANVVSGNVKGFQGAGILNTVGGNTDGAQLAGIVNLVGGDVHKVQGAGIGNVVLGNVYGVQGAGIYNFTWKHTEGVQLAGIVNYTRSFHGVQAAGIVNTVWKKSDGFQLAGIINAADSLEGMQVAGIANVARYVKGVQLSGIINAAKRVDGIQVGFINVADTVSGVPVGFLSFVRKGYHKIELSTDENLLNTLSFRTGVSRFHNIFTASTQFTPNNRIWSTGYGVGTTFKLSNRLNLDIDATGQQLQVAGNNSFDYNLLSKFYVGVEWQFAPKVSLAAGPTLNWLNSDLNGDDFHLIEKQLTVPSFYRDEGVSFVNQLWIGGKVAIRFL
ncbi:MAG: hypothetical protein A3D31_01560 [Candidatus Fluviicola riflensis]|nr:MAG: hypothetical protein CHH17_03980 [Candidatus Fluviicola riflensis]OGS76288.1 MAG: hypothetical protein A3D31_01560 [Candidatus Fluviicola riflensis]OGS83168.1 MAG: hypothetical protein A2724_00280 [Fluviicola sp. RIFCSPHIGHO2_01_FULL_43_53]OGS83820.1 MAG: hypothetical protein A3E30_18165 [Fluviicola sp. RIFCSPHIGHO2_12_FULL_43_24]